jgi:hypothetical protein
VTAPANEQRAQLSVAELALIAAVVAVAALGAVALALAIAGWYSLWAALGLTLALTGAAAAAVARLAPPPAVRVDARGLVVLGLVGAFTAIMFLPGFPYAAGDKDPGIYVIHAMAIDREGATRFTDEVATLDAEGVLPVQYFGPGSRFPGLWRNHRTTGTDIEVQPQFYHQFPALLAVAHGLGDLAGGRGPSAVFHLNPLLAALSVVAVAAAARRAFGWPTALVAAALLSTNMLQVWQAKYPSTEILAQLFVVGAILAVMVAVETRWRPAAAAGGLLVGASWLVRPDGFLVVLLAVAVVAGLLALGRADARTGWFVGGLVATMPLVLLQTYHVNLAYSLSTDVPGWPVFTAATLGLLALGMAVRAASTRPSVRQVLDRASGVLGGPDGAQRIVGIVAVVGFALLLVAFWHRETLLGVDHLIRNQQRIRSYDEQSLIRLSWYLTVPGLVAVVAGLAVVTAPRWRANQFLLAAPGLVLLPLYLWAARNSPQMMWWGRRFVPIVLVALLVLMAVAIGWLLRPGGRRAIGRQIAGGALAVFLVVTYLGQSWPLRDHREFGGSYDFVQSVSEVADGNQAVFLWEFPTSGIFDPARTFAGPLWFVEGHHSAFLPRPDPDGDAHPDDWIDVYLDRFGHDHQVFVITRGLEVNLDLDLSRLELEAVLHQEMPYWEERKERRPTETMAEQGRPLFMSVQVWRVDQRTEDAR